MEILEIGDIVAPTFSYSLEPEFVVLSAYWNKSVHVLDVRTNHTSTWQRRNLILIHRLESGNCEERVNAAITLLKLKQ